MTDSSLDLCLSQLSDARFGEKKSKIGQYCQGSLLAIRIFAFLPFSIFCISFWPFSAVAEEANKQIYIGSCVLEVDPSDLAFEQSPYFCIQGSLGLSALSSSHYPESATSRYMRLYLGTHPYSLLSLHYKGAIFHKKFLQSALDANQMNQTELGIVKLGNSATNNLRASIGWQTLPVAINHDPFKPLFYPESSYEIWDTLKQSIVLTWDNMFDFQVNLGVARENVSLRASSYNNAIAIQAFSDVSSLDGTRFSVSFYSEENGIRRASVGVLNISRKDEIFSLEWVRQRLDPTGKLFPFQQVIRFTYEGNVRRSSKWSFLYDHVRKMYRESKVGYEYFLYKNFSISNVLSYRASDNDSIISSWKYLVNASVKL
ncbi:MAG: hypothetical protein R3B45_00425 [Bdellovibrionota bacterium]